MQNGAALYYPGNMKNLTVFFLRFPSTCIHRFHTFHII